jgi:Flp pilus assembly protein TadG
MSCSTVLRRRRRQGGNAALEGALILLPMFAIILGIAEFSLSMFIMGLLQEDARTTARYISTFNMTYNSATYSTQTSLAQQMMIDGSLGFINANNVGTYLQVNFYFPDDLTTPATSAQLPHTWTDSAGQVQTVQWVNAPGNVAEVRIVNFFAGLYAGQERDVRRGSGGHFVGLAGGAEFPAEPVGKEQR